MTKYTTLAIPRGERPALDILGEFYRKEKGLITPPTAIDSLIFALRECLLRRGVDFLPKPEDGEAIPVIKGVYHA